MSSILLNNFPKKLGFMSRHNENTKTWEREPSSFMGFHSTESEVNKGYISAIRKLFVSLLLHDVIYLRHEDYISCFALLGFENMLALLERDVIKIVYDFHDYSFSFDEGKYNLGIMTRLAPMRDLHEGYTSISHENQALQARLRFLTEKNQVLLNSSDNIKVDDSLARSIVEEVQRDVSNEKFCSHFEIDSQIFTTKKALTSLRICDTLTGYSLQKKLDVEAIVQDVFAKDYAKNKLLISNFREETTECFESIMTMKGIPDLFDLYTKDIISFDEILKIREKTQARVFRRWIEEKEYDPNEIVKELLKPCKSSINSKVVSFIYPNIIGLLNPIAGVLAAATDSFFVKMVTDNWNPKLFLDENLSAFLDKKLQLHQKEQLKANRKKYGNLSEADPCYCGSGKIFIKCHGK
jgi:hypothetical protein